MSIRAQSGERSYPLCNGYFDLYYQDDSKYIDITEIKAGTSEYMTELLAGFEARDQIEGNNHHYKLKSTVAIQAALLDFTITGILVCGSEAFYKVNGYLLDDDRKWSFSRYTPLWSIAPNIVHPLRFKRIYTKWTDARNIWLVGNCKGNM